MGATIGALCKNCNDRFVFNAGGGMRFHMLRCDTCGKEKEVGFDELGELHYQYLKGSSGCYAIATKEHDNYVKEYYKGRAITDEEYHAEIEKRMKKCKCGGSFTFNAPVRCPLCWASNYEEDGEPHLLYD